MHAPLSPCLPRPLPGLVARLHRLLDRSGGPDACWPARRCLARSGQRGVRYPILQESGKRGKFWRVCRLVLLLEEIPLEGFRSEQALYKWLRLANLHRREVEASHKCDNSLCGNPRHLEWKDHGEQVREQAARRAQAAQAPQEPAA